MNTKNKANFLFGRTPWPNTIRAFPSVLVKTLFASTTSTKRLKVTDTPRSAKLSENKLIEIECSTTLSMMHMRVLIELIDICKGLKHKEGGIEGIEFSPGKLLERLNKEKTGTAYKDLELKLKELATTPVTIYYLAHTGEIELMQKYCLLDDFEGRSKRYFSGEGEVFEEPLEEEADKTRPIWFFKISRLLVLLMNMDFNASLHINAINKHKQSPIEFWLISWIAANGFNGKTQYKYSARKIMEMAGLSELSKINKTGKTRSGLRKAAREYTYRIRDFLRSLAKDKYIKHTEMERTVSSNNMTYQSEDVKFNITRFKTEIENILHSITSPKDRANHLLE